MHKAVIFSSFYLPPLAYFSAIQHADTALLIDKHEHFPKQTYRNRATIHSPNGKLDLIVPVVKGAKVHTAMKDVKVSYEFNWQRLHWLSIQTSYRSSAYFEFYEDAFAPFYHQKWDFLFDYNEEMNHMVFEKLKMKPLIKYSENYIAPSAELQDYRTLIHPKKEAQIEVKPYFQVFEDRNGFIPNLSIIDLLFNQGPQALKYL
ncbi:MAG: WbqC family protein [Sphingobacteriaceae bacterium]